MSSNQALMKTHELRSVSLLVCPYEFVCVWVCLCVGVGVFVCVHLRKKKMRRGKLSSLVVHGEKREKKMCERKLIK